MLYALDRAVIVIDCKQVWGSENIASQILNLGTELRRVVRITDQHLFFQGRNARAHLRGERVRTYSYSERLG
jgi:hypothetical protein